MPGGRDRPYHASLGDEGAKRIRCWLFFILHLHLWPKGSLWSKGGLTLASAQAPPLFSFSKLNTKQFFKSVCLQELTLHLREYCSSQAQIWRWRLIDYLEVHLYMKLVTIIIIIIIKRWTSCALLPSSLGLHGGRWLGQSSNTAGWSFFSSSASSLSSHGKFVAGWHNLWDFRAA